MGAVPPGTEDNGVARTKGTTTAWLVVVSGVAGVSAHLVTDRSGAHLQLAPVFVGAALAVATVWVSRSRSRRRRG
jgi:hypothetical protein